MNAIRLTIHVYVICKAFTVLWSICCENVDNIFKYRWMNNALNIHLAWVFLGKPIKTYIYKLCWIQKLHTHCKLSIKKDACWSVDWVCKKVSLSTKLSIHCKCFKEECLFLCRMGLPSPTFSLRGVRSGPRTWRWPGVNWGTLWG